MLAKITDEPDNETLVCIFLSFFDERKLPARYFSALLEKLVDHWKTWNQAKYRYGPGFKIHEDAEDDSSHSFLRGDIHCRLWNALSARFNRRRVPPNLPPVENVVIRCGPGSILTHAAVLFPTWPFFAAHVRELAESDPLRTEAVKFELVIPNFETEPLTPGALLPSLVGPLLQARYQSSVNQDITPCESLLFLLSLRMYDLAIYLPHCYARFTSNMDLEQMLDIILTATKLGAFEPGKLSVLAQSIFDLQGPTDASTAQVVYGIPPLSLPEEKCHMLVDRIADLTRILHTNLAQASGLDRWNELDTTVRRKIVASGYDSKDIARPDGDSVESKTASKPTSSDAGNQVSDDESGDDLFGDDLFGDDLFMKSSPRKSAPAVAAPPLPIGHYPIMVRTLTGKSIEISGSGHTSTTDVKKNLHDREGIPPCQQRLIHGGIQLEDGRTFADYSVSPCSTMHLVLRLRGG